jgi:hypothetical protein
MRGAQIACSLAHLVKAWGVGAIVGEMPSGGAKSAMAMRCMAAATTAVAATAAVLGVPAEWCTPTDVKLATTGLKSGTKDEVMASVAAYYGWAVQAKKVRRKTGVSERKTFYVPCRGLGLNEFRMVPGGVFEHIADAIGAYWAMRDSNLVRMFAQAA